MSVKIFSFCLFYSYQILQDHLCVLQALSLTNHQAFQILVKLDVRISSRGIKQGLLEYLQDHFLLQKQVVISTRPCCCQAQLSIKQQFIQVSFSSILLALQVQQQLQLRQLLITCVFQDSIFFQWVQNQSLSAHLQRKQVQRLSFNYSKLFLLFQSFR